MVLQLLDEGLIKLEDPIGKCLANFRSGLGNNFTIDDLLRYKSSL